MGPGHTTEGCEHPLTSKKFQKASRKLLKQCEGRLQRLQRPHQRSGFGCNCCEFRTQLPKSIICLTCNLIHTHIALIRYFSPGSTPRVQPKQSRYSSGSRRVGGCSSTPFLGGGLPGGEGISKSMILGRSPGKR